MSQLVDYAKAVRSGTIIDPTFSGFIYEIPREADVWDESNWPLANPASMISAISGHADHGRTARRMPTIEASFRNLLCNQRIDAEERWLPYGEWKECLREVIDLEELDGERCYGGLDLGSVRDMTSFALYWPDSGSLKVWTWCPKDNLRAREDSDRVPYTVWAEQGWIEPTPGKATNKRMVALRLAEICARFSPEAIAFDPWGITELERVIWRRGHHPSAIPAIRPGLQVHVAGNQSPRGAGAEPEARNGGEPALHLGRVECRDRIRCGRQPEAVEGAQHARESIRSCGHHGGRNRRGRTTAVRLLARRLSSQLENQESIRKS